MMTFFWDDKKEKELIRLWSEGKSASEIASIIGNISRNHIIGVVHRLKLPGRIKKKITTFKYPIPIEYDPDKFSKNLFKHKVNFNIAKNFEHDKL
jgi:hypothetical protein